MSVQLKAVLFDLDDTLVDWGDMSESWQDVEARHLASLYRHVQEVGGKLSADLATFSEHYGRRLREAWMSARSTLRAPQLGKIIAETLTNFGYPVTDAPTLEACLRAYNWGAVRGVHAFPEVPQVLETLNAHGIKTGIVTNAHQPMWVRDVELAQYGLLHYFPEAGSRVSAADAGYLKPHPRAFQGVLDALSVTPQEAVFVGDNPVADIAGAQGLGMRGVLRLKGDNQPPLISGLIVPDAIIYDMRDLLKHLDDWFFGWRG